jgi:hypothetical protein
MWGSWSGYQRNAACQYLTQAQNAGSFADAREYLRLLSRSDGHDFAQKNMLSRQVFDQIRKNSKFRHFFQEITHNNQ